MSIVMYLLAVLMMVIVDQAVKYWAVTMLASIGTIPLIPGVLSLTYVENRGAAFSIFRKPNLAVCRTGSGDSVRHCICTENR